MGSSESTPAPVIEDISAQNNETDSKNIIGTVEKMISEEYGRIEEELAHAARGYAATSAEKAALLKEKYSQKPAVRGVCCESESEQVRNCLVANKETPLECRSVVDSFKACAATAVVHSSS